MVLIKKCVSDRNYLLRYPEFTADENRRKKENRAILRMNNFYSTIRDEIIAYCGELSAENPRVMYLMDIECTVSEGEECRILSDGDALPLQCALTVRIALVLRSRPAPTRRQAVIHTWQNGYLVK